ncbi:MAG: AAA family ATPase [Chloroflexota bacterium]
MHLRSIALDPIPADLNRQFPFSVSVVRTFEKLELQSPITFLVGENGSGKSTILEGLACAIDLPAVGGEPLQRDRTLDGVRPLADYFRLVWTKRTKRGFFLRAEDFFGFAKRIQQLEAEMQAELRRVEEEYRDRSERARGFARMPFARELADLKRLYGDGLDTVSHGEGFLHLFQNRFVPNGLYLLDEPEAPLSPIRQIGFLSLLREMVEQHNAQFIIATHSPILMAFPGATILSFDAHPVKPIAYDELEHVTLTRDFLNDPETFLRYL